MSWARIRSEVKWLVPIGVLMVAAVASGLYILSQQRLRNPFETRYTVNAELTATMGLNSGMGQPVKVAGVQVGAVRSAKLGRGTSVIELEINPEKLPHVYENANVMLVPNTPLKDMQVELSPGGPPAKPIADGGTIPISNTTPPIDSDELTAMLDTDTRDYFQLLMAGADQGTRGRGKDLQKLFKALGPTAAQIRELTSALATRRQAMRRVVHNLSAVSQVTGSRREQLGELIAQSNRTLTAVAEQDQALSSAVAELPGTLAATRSTVRNATGFANQLTPTLSSLEPVVEELPEAFRAAEPLIKDSEHLLRTKIRPFTEAAQPLAAEIRPATERFNEMTPHLQDSFQVLSYVANELGYNPPGDNEGFLFWLAWMAHNTASFFSSEDAHGAVARGFAIVSCNTVRINDTVARVVNAIFGPLEC
jgi:phospholipid/cholesterol/gamma-HCH transport system substrate-binding protein